MKSAFIISSIVKAERTLPFFHGLLRRLDLTTDFITKKYLIELGKLAENVYVK